jgi:organic hydroperoxide reductase OsmC/OhrA
MSEHSATILWQNTGPDFLSRRYSRAHTWRFDGGTEIPASPSPHIVPTPWSTPANVDPEEAFVASVASCHMLWFLHVCVDSGFEAASYEDNAVGELTGNLEGRLWISRIRLRPSVLWKDSKQPRPDQVARLHQQAHAECFIANSIKTAILIEAG